jgi:hypothetical protein
MELESSLRMRKRLVGLLVALAIIRQARVILMPCCVAAFPMSSLVTSNSTPRMTHENVDFLVVTVAEGVDLLLRSWNLRGVPTWSWICFASASRSGINADSSTATPLRYDVIDDCLRDGMLVRMLCSAFCVENLVGILEIWTLIFELMLIRGGG